MSKKILFVPGLLCDRRLFDAQIQHLQAKGADCAVADITGSDHVESLADHVLNTVIRGSADWSMVALSMGGYVAFELLRKAGDKFSRLVLMHTSARPDTPEQISTRRGLIELADKGDFKGVTPRLLPRLLHPDNLQKPDLTSVIKDMAKDIGKESFINQQTAIMTRPDSRDFIQTIKQPTMVVAGQGDVITPPDILKEINQLIPNSRLSVLDGVGHLSPLESPIKINHLIDDFILKS